MKQVKSSSGWATRGIAAAAVGALSLLLGGCGEQVMVFNPVGPVGRIEQRLIVLSFVLVMIVVVPVIGLFWYIVRRYRDRPNNPAPYDPEWSESRTLEVIWWAIPIIIVAILGAYTARDTFALTQPPEKVSSPLTVWVTSLDWKWLFLYPGQKIATVNYCEIPTNRPIQFVLTSNAPMNSFWVPQLGGQEYTMPGMAMRLWLQADRPGDYYGHGANFSGRGFAHMQFDVVAKADPDFQKWVEAVRRTAPALTEVGYRSLVRQNIVPRLSFSSFPPHVFTDTIMKEGGMYMKRNLSILGTKD